jgi:hypothetical protein
MSNTEHFQQLAEDAYIWSFPRMLWNAYWQDYKKAGAPLNQLFAMSKMATPDHGGVNVDTLYGVGWLDLRSEPVVISLPEAQDRYYSLQLVDVYGNNFAYIGRRCTGTTAQNHLLAPPDWSGATPDNMPVIKATSSLVFGFLRTLIDDENDLEHASKFNQGIAISPLSNFPAGRVHTTLMDNLGPYFPHSQYHLDKHGARYYDLLGDALLEQPPTSAEDIALMAGFKAIGIGPGKHPTTDNPLSIPALEEAVNTAHKRIFGVSTSTIANGWATTLYDEDRVRTDPLFKAALNRMGIALANPEEAIYLMPAPLDLQPDEKMPSWQSMGPDKQPLTGNKTYRLRFPAGELPPVDAFWSITMYTQDLKLVPNPINRYAIGDRTDGLAFGEDGSLELLFQHHEPDTGTSNWLPTPEGRFELWLRIYQPRPELIAGSYRLPTLEII